MKSWILTTAATLAAFSASAGDITGKITVKGELPKAPTMPIKSDPNCGKFAAADKPAPWYVVGAAGELADVFVYLKDAKGKGAAPSPVLLDQKGCEYLPYVVGAQVGQPIGVRNSDPLIHNVHPMPVAEGNKEANKAQLAGSPDFSFTWDKPEVLLKFKCDIHPWMFAYVGLVENSYFAVTAKDGTFKIANVPPGEYTIEAFHRKSHAAAGKGASQKVKVDAGGGKADFVIEVK